MVQVGHYLGPMSNAPAAPVATHSLARVSSSTATTHLAILLADGRIVALECGQRGGRYGLGQARKVEGMNPTCTKCAAMPEGQRRAAIPAPPAA